MRHVRMEIGEILHIFPSGTESMGDRGSKKAYTGPRTGIYLPTKLGCDRSIVVGCRSWNERQTDKQNGMTIRLTLCERDAIERKRVLVHVMSPRPSVSQLVCVSGVLWKNGLLDLDAVWDGELGRSRNWCIR